MFNGWHLTDVQYEDFLSQRCHDKTVKIVWSYCVFPSTPFLFSHQEKQYLRCIPNTGIQGPPPNPLYNRSRIWGGLPILVRLYSHWWKIYTRQILDSFPRNPGGLKSQRKKEGEKTGKEINKSSWFILCWHLVTPVKFLSDIPYPSWNPIFCWTREEDGSVSDTQVSSKAKEKTFKIYFLWQAIPSENLKSEYTDLILKGQVILGWRAVKQPAPEFSGMSVSVPWKDDPFRVLGWWQCLSEGPHLQLRDWTFPLHHDREGLHTAAALTGGVESLLSAGSQSCDDTAAQAGLCVSVCGCVDVCKD